MMNMSRYCPQCGNELKLQSVDCVERLACQETGCHYVHWDNPVPVVAGLVIYQKALLLARNQLWPAGRFSLITGYLGRHEAPEQAMRRELDEELGLTAESVRFIGHYPFGMKNQFLIAYALRTLGELKLSDEIAEVRAVPLNEVEKYDFGPFELTRIIVHDWIKASTSPDSESRTVSGIIVKLLA
ncbi:MAG: NUDIX domain-containing protein [Nitrospira sp.]|nr:NUDIX domain-containing protein [Nitrospira sp.]